MYELCGLLRLRINHGTLHQIVFLVILSYFEALNMQNACHEYSVDYVSKTKSNITIIFRAMYEASWYHWPTYLQINVTIFVVRTVIIIIMIIKSEIGNIAIFRLGHQTMVYAECFMIFLLICDIDPHWQRHVLVFLPWIWSPVTIMEHHYLATCIYMYTIDDWHLAEMVLFTHISHCCLSEEGTRHLPVSVLIWYWGSLYSVPRTLYIS